MNSSFGAIGPTKATVSPWTPLPVAGPNRGGLPDRIMHPTNIPTLFDTWSGGSVGWMHCHYIVLLCIVSVVYVPMHITSGYGQICIDL